MEMATSCEGTGLEHREMATGSEGGGGGYREMATNSRDGEEQDTGKEQV